MIVTSRRTHTDRTTDSSENIISAADTFTWLAEINAVYCCYKANPNNYYNIHSTGTHRLPQTPGSKRTTIIHTTALARVTSGPVSNSTTDQPFTDFCITFDLATFTNKDSVVVGSLIAQQSSKVCESVIWHT